MKVLLFANVVAIVIALYSTLGAAESIPAHSHSSTGAVNADTLSERPVVDARIETEFHF